VLAMFAVTAAGALAVMGAGGTAPPRPCFSPWAWLDRLRRSWPDVDRDIMDASSRPKDPFARAGLTILRSTGLRLGELLDLELECLWDFASHFFEPHCQRGGDRPGLVAEAEAGLVTAEQPSPLRQTTPAPPWPPAWP